MRASPRRRQSLDVRGVGTLGVVVVDVVVEAVGAESQELMASDVAPAPVASTHAWTPRLRNVRRSIGEDLDTQRHYWLALDEPCHLGAATLGLYDAVVIDSARGGMVILQDNEFADDGRPWYAVPRPVTQVPSTRRVVSASGLSGLSLTLADLSGGQQSWVTSCIQGALLSVVLAVFLVLARPLLTRRNRD